MLSFSIKAMGQATRVFFIFMNVLLIFPSSSIAKPYIFGPFDPSVHYNHLNITGEALINKGALQLTPDSLNHHQVTLMNQSGRVMLNNRFKLWEGDRAPSSNRTINLATKVASFNTSFLINIYRLNDSLPSGEGLAFVIAPDLLHQTASNGQYLGLTNATTDGNSSNRFIAVEFDTFKQDFDPDENHIGLDINGVRSNKTVSLSKLGFELSPTGRTMFFMVWIDYDGVNKVLRVFMADQDSINVTKTKPDDPIMTVDGLDISDTVDQYSYFGFTGSTGSAIELNCVLRWNLTVEELLDGSGLSKEFKIAVGVGVSFAVLSMCFGFGVYYYLRNKASKDPNIVGTLKCLPGTPKEYKFRDLKKATNNFDEKMKLGKGGFGEVYKGVMPKEKEVIAVKKFSRDNIKSKDDFLAELTIINRLRHKHLVSLSDHNALTLMDDAFDMFLGWCYTNGMLLLVYDYMPNGSLDTHIFNDTTSPLGWSLRCKILSGVASALHYLHNDYDQTVVHRDLKPSNIMLDAHFNARLGDFGLARAIEHGKTSYAELNSPGVPGTVGYIAPECLHTGKATRESDIYAFGAVILEVVSGQRPWVKIGGYGCLVDWVWSCYREARILEAVDERLRGEAEDCVVVEEAERLLLLGLACSNPTASERPKTEDVVKIISGSMSSPYVPPFRPAFVWSSPGGEYADTTVSMVSSQINISSDVSIV